MDLFDQNLPGNQQDQRNIPLAERVRPRDLEALIGHQDVVGPGTFLYEALKKQRLPSIIFWGPPGVGKTTLARILADHVKGEFVSMSAVTSGVADVRKVIEKAKNSRKFYSKTTVLFIDEIHRFNKSQQDALLHAVEDGTLILIGATTENPSFEIISPLLSRCHVLTLKLLENQHIRNIIELALKNDSYLNEKQIKIEDWDAFYILSGGDARRALNTLEKTVDFLEAQEPPYVITHDILEKAAQKKVLYYDKNGEYHYDLISAFIKSVRGSDPDAAVYWMARMLEGGEDPKFIARRMIILASEDVGNADPQALVVATNCFTAVTYIGMPEGQIVLSQAATYLASAPKSNAAYMAIRGALQDVREQSDIQVPLHLRNAPTDLMKQLDYGKDYQYAHDFEENFVQEHYLPESHRDRLYYRPGFSGAEKNIRERLERLWSGIKNYAKLQPSKSKHQDD